jgi:hypothetical protein
MAVIYQGMANRDTICNRCQVPILVGDEVFVYQNRGYCSLTCVEEMVAEQPGTDFVATQDQALAAVRDVLATRPQQFAFLFKPPPGEGDVGVTLFCQGTFVVECVEALARASVEAEPSVSPPDED